jgi:hypothetical protein
MKTQHLFATRTNRQNLRDTRRFPRPATRRASGSRLALESLEPRALLTASPAFASFVWKETLPESYWMATCKAADSTPSCPPATDESTSDGQSECDETAKTVPVWGGRSTASTDTKTVCTDTKTVCTDTKTTCDEQDCQPKRSCDSTPETEWRKSDCNGPTPEQVRQAIHEKIAAFLHKVGYNCDDNYDECETPKTDCASSDKQATGKRWGSSCDDDSPKNCDQPESESQQQRCNWDKTETSRVVERCVSDSKWSDSVHPTRYR